MSFTPGILKESALELIFIIGSGWLRAKSYFNIRYLVPAGGLMSNLFKAKTFRERKFVLKYLNFLFDVRDKKL